MESQHILIIEDNLSFALELEIYLANWGSKELKTIDNSADALAYINDTPPDLILMDINIKGKLNGVEIAQKIKHLEIPIIFITGQKEEHFYEDAKNTNAVSYLIKPFDEMTLRGAIELSLLNNQIPKIIKKESRKSDIFFIRKGKTLQKISIKDIKWVKSDSNYCDLIWGEHKSTIKMPIKKLMEQLPEDEFIRIHRQYIIRIGKIENVMLTKGIVRVEDRYFPIGRTYKKELLKRMKII